MSWEEIYGIGLSIFLSLYPIFFGYSLGATPIGSAVAHPIERSRQKGRREVETGDKGKSWWTWDLGIIGCLSSARNFGYIADKINLDYSHRELFMKVKKDNSNFFVYWISQTRLRNIILELRHRDKTWMPWLKHIMKVRPQDPSCAARYTHMDALCWNLSMSTMRRKSWWTHWVP
jgi:hypothetical protein